MAFTTIDDPESFFQVKLYTGDASTTQAQTLDGTTDMQPDMIWIKQRNGTNNNMLADAVRGANNKFNTNTNAGNDTGTTSLKAFSSDGFSVGSNTEAGASSNYAAYCWKAGTTSGINTTGADITPSAYSFNQTSGISIIQYTGNSSTDQQIAHGLGAVPHFIMCKVFDADNPQNWDVYHHKNTSAPETDYLNLNDNGATADSVSRWQDTAPTSVLFTVGDAGAVNQTGDTIMGYLFSEKRGFSRFGSFVGNGSNDGPFLWCGFKPAWFMSKRSDAAASWNVWNHKSNPHNVSDKLHYADGGDAENTTAQATYAIDFLSNGIKMRGYRADTNTSGAVHIWAAFAEAPFVNSNGVPCNAR